MLAIKTILTVWPKTLSLKKTKNNHATKTIPTRNLGSVASVNLLQTDEAVGSLRQRLHDYECIPTVVTYHLAYLLRKPADKKKS